MGTNFSCNKPTIGFQGYHKSKQQITYKKEGQIFLIDCLCSDGYTYDFHFGHQIAFEKIIHTDAHFLCHFVRIDFLIT